MEITNKYIGSHFLGPLILTGLVHFNGFTIDFYHVENFNWVVGIFFVLKLNKAISLVLIGNFVSRNMDIDYGTALEEHLPNDIFVNFGI